MKYYVLQIRQKKSLIKFGSIALICFLLKFCALPEAEKFFFLVENSASRGVIVVPADAGQNVLETGRDLSDIIARMSGAHLPVISRSEGKPRLVLAVQDQDRSLPPLAYHVWREDSILYFSGGSDQGVINGVYAFLEQELGCRWYTPDDLGEYIPQYQTLKIAYLQMQDSPDFESIAGFGRHPNETASRMWMRRNGIEGSPPYFHSHNWFNIIPAESFEEHPEWFALLGNGRSTRQLCTTHPQVLDITVAAARRYFDENPQMQSFSLSPNDHRGFCRCNTCFGLDAKLGIDPFIPGGSLSDRLVYFFNQVATEVEKTHPQKRLAFYAYLTYTQPPQVVKPHPLLLPVLVHTPWEYCMHHAIDDRDCERNRRFVDNVLGWQEITPNLMMYDYYGHWSLGGPMGMVHRIRRDLPWLNRHSGIGMYAEAHPQWWTQGLNLYIPPKLAWDLNADVDAIVAEYYENMFGPAAPEISAYGQMFEDVMAQVPKDAAHDFEQAFLVYMTPNFLSRATALLDSGEARIRKSGLAQQEVAAINERIRRYRYGLRITEHQAQEKQARLDGRMEKVIAHLKELTSILNEIAADTTLSDMIGLPLMKLFSKNELSRLPPYDLIWQKAIPSAQRRANLLQKLDQGHRREVARALGYWNDWYVLGLWTNPGGDAMNTHFPPEDRIDLDATYSVRGGEAVWWWHQSESAYGVVDLREHFRPEDTEYTVAYAYTTIKMREDAEVFMDIRCDDDIVVWVNNQLAFGGGAGNHNFNLHLSQSLQRGENRILTKILNKPHAFNFSLRIISEDGQPHPAVEWE
jgi:hypothetical protein